VLLLSFAVTLLVAALISQFVDRSVLSMTVLFLVVGLTLGSAGAHLLPVPDQQHLTEQLAEISLFAVLFTDGMQIRLRDLKRWWRLPTRALLLGLPLSLLAIAALAHWTTGLPWLQSLLVGGALAPTDPVLASAIVGRKDISPQLRHLLSVESGLNDGLALPVVIGLLAVLGSGMTAQLPAWLDLALGVVVGIALPLLVSRVRRLRFVRTTERFEPLLVLAVGLTMFGVTRSLGANPFLAAFIGGIVLASADRGLTISFHQFGDLVAELLKLLVALLLGALVTLSLFTGASARVWLFALVVLVLVRPITLGPLLLGSPFSRRERAVALWFGPKGFTSAVYGLLIRESGVPGSELMFQLIALTIVLSIVLHSSTDVLAARWLGRGGDESVEPVGGLEADRLAS
jgi:NhaP-type Na+/H+ or K+/H+ antiporter